MTTPEPAQPLPPLSISEEELALMQDHLEAWQPDVCVWRDDLEHLIEVARLMLGCSAWQPIVEAVVAEREACAKLMDDAAVKLRKHVENRLKENSAMEPEDRDGNIGLSVGMNLADAAVFAAAAAIIRAQPLPEPPR
jgi:hypothetical protein